METGGLAGKPADELLAGYIREIGDRLPLLPPPLAGAAAYRDLRSRVRDSDIFAGVKRAFILHLTDALPQLEKGVSADPHPLQAALRAATWGNLMDVAQGRPMPDPDRLLGALLAPLAVDETAVFEARAAEARLIVVFGDNAGETVLDGLMIGNLPVQAEVVYAVRPLPVLNDATTQDALDSGIGSRARIMDTGLDAPTVRIGMLSPGLAAEVERADLILSKGQGNLEGLLGESDPRLYYSFVVKCPVIGDLTGLPGGSGVFVSSLRLPDWGERCLSTSISAASAT
jgi:damage-control phosphatase, subfamily I